MQRVCGYASWCGWFICLYAWPQYFGGEVGDALSRHVYLVFLSACLVSIAFSRYLRHPACLLTSVPLHVRYPRHKTSP
ncbi:hypothetical protein CI102_1429 [Trichoderma harzianum]|nr:hypothetical protein CI102_1429 [Trichoderma harzianum]